MIVHRARRHWLFDGLQYVKTIFLIGAVGLLLWLRPKLNYWLRTDVADYFTEEKSSNYGEFGILMPKESPPEWLQTVFSITNYSVLTCAAIIGLLGLLGNAIYFSHEYAVTNRRVIFKTGFIRRHVFEVSLRHIEAVEIKQSIIGRIMSFGTIAISGTGKVSAAYPNIMSPAKFREAVHANDVASPRVQS